MITREYIEAKLELVFDDERIWQPSATVIENAPLALIQMSLEARAFTLCEILEITFEEAKKEYKRKKGK
ncbi:hypothetical protein LCGC14_0963650 [marine sediment metagenome]|uniref:Uncharacterized protein n=1 Tax=marine sediment metagenome TaxID=412755 RepID=A0A0F9NZT1_9ZZZZ|nr:hypothetical protein [Candidatus Aminicenantes bacterium]